MLRYGELMRLTSGGRPMEGAQAAGWLLLAGGAVFFGLGFGILPFQGDTPFRKRWVATSFIVAFVLVALAFQALGDARENIWFASASTLALIATPLLVVAMAAYGAFPHLPVGGDHGIDHLTKMERGVVRLSGAAISAFMVLEFMAMALVGVGSFQTHLLPDWASWFSVALGTFLALTFPLKWLMPFWIADLPLWVPLWGLVIAVPLIQAA